MSEGMIEGNREEMTLRLKKSQSFWAKAFTISPCYYVVGLIVLSFLVRSFLGIKYGQMSVFYDELIHWTSGRNLALNGSLLVRGFPRSQSDVLYTLLLSPIHLFLGIERSYQLAIIINSALMASSLLPIFKLARLFKLDKGMSLVICLVTAALPEFSYSSYIVQENLYLPIMMWFLYYAAKVLLHLDENQAFIRDALITAFLLVPLLATKQLAYFVFVAWILILAFHLLIKEKPKKPMVIVIIITMAVCLVAYLLFNQGLRALQQYSDYKAIGGVGFSLQNVLKSIFDLASWQHYLYAFYSYITKTVLVTGVVPLLFCIVFFRRLPKPVQRFCLFILCQMLLITGYVVLIFYRRENYGEAEIRFHYRYLFYYLPSILILFFYTVKILAQTSWRKWEKIVLAALSLLFVISISGSIGKNGSGSVIDSPSFNFFQNLEGNRIIIAVSVALFIITIGILVFRKTYKLFLGVFFTSILVVFLLGNIYQYDYSSEIKQREAPTIQDMKNIDYYLRTNATTDDEPVLFLANYETELCLAECYFRYPYFYLVSSDIALTEAWDLDVRKSNFMLTSQVFSAPKSFQSFEYIVTTLDISSEFIGFEKVLVSEKISLFKRIRDLPSRVYMASINPAYKDNWIVRGSSLLCPAPPNLEQITFSFTASSPYVGDQEVSFIDDLGNLQTIEVTNEEKTYMITVHKEVGDGSFNVNIVPEKTFKADNGDPRELSFLLKDLSINNESVGGN